MTSNFLDRTIGFFAPERGAKRVAARKRMELLDGVRLYEGASMGRLAKGWSTTSGDANSEIARAAPTLRDRSRDAVRNNPLAAKIVTSHANNFVGFGITPRFKTGDKERDKKLTELFDEWSKVCHVDGATDFYGLIYLLARLMVQDGEVYLRKRNRFASDGLPVPLQLQVLVSEFCDWAKTVAVEGNQVVNGIEFNAIGQRRGYWMFPQNPKSVWSVFGSPYVSNFVPATEIAHLYDAQDSQIHGVPWLAPVLTELKDLRDYELAENIRKKIEACSVGTVVPGDNDSDDDPNLGIYEADAGGAPASPRASVTDVYGNPMERMEPGMFHVLNGGKDIKFNTPAISAGMEAYLRTRHRSIAAGARTTYELLTGDFSQANFASGKLGLLEYQRFVGHVQWHIIIPQVLERVGGWFIEAARLVGKIPANVNVKIEWTPPEIESITRLDDARADLIEMRMGKRSPQEVIAKTGRDPQQVLEEIDEWNTNVDATKSNVILDSDPRNVTLQGQLQIEPGGGDKEDRMSQAREQETEVIKMFSRAAGDLMEKEIRIPKSIYGDVEVRADTFNEDDRTVEVCWSTGAAVKRYSWDEGYYMEELQVDKKSIRLDRFSAMSLLDTHDNYSMESRLGTVVPGSVRFENGKAYARIKFSRKQRAEEIMQDIRDGHPLPISVGYKIHRYEKTEGADGQLPVLRAIDWEPLELSAVPIPADAGAISRSEPKGGDFETVMVRQETPNAASPATTKERPMNKREAAKKYTGDQLDALALGAGLSRSEGETDEALRARLLAAYDKEERAADEAEKARKAAEAEMTRRSEEDEAKRRANQNNEQKPQPVGLTPQQVEEAKRQAVADEVQRRKDIETFAATATEFASSDLVRKALDEGHTLEQFRNAILDNMVRRQAQTPTFPHADHRRQDSQETMRRMVANAILHRSGIVDTLEDGAREWRSMSTMDIVKEVMRSRGENVRGSLHDIAERGLHSTSDFPIILGDITRQTLLNAYGRFENTFQLFATRTLLSDFRETKVLDIGSAPDLKRKNEAGEFTSGTIRESEEGMRLHSYGRKIGFTREMLINDQLNAFMQLVANWGLKAGKLEGDIVWGAIIDNAAMKDGTPLFHSSHKNLAGTGTALDKANLIKARKAFRQQKDIDGEPIDITPKYLFTGSELETDAQTLIAAAYTPTTSGEVMPVAIKSLQPVYEYRLDKIPTNAWFLFADAVGTMGRGIKYLHLLGSEAPRTNERIGFDVEGVEYTIAHDFGVGFDDYRFAYKNPGVAPQ